MQRREKEVPLCSINSISLDLLHRKILRFGGWRLAIWTNPHSLWHKSLEYGYLPNHDHTLGKEERDAFGWDCLERVVFYFLCTDIWAFHAFIIHLSSSWLICVCNTKHKNQKAPCGRTSHTLGACDRPSFTAWFSIKHGGVTMSHPYCRINLQHSRSCKREHRGRKERRKAKNSLFELMSVILCEGQEQGLWHHQCFSSAHHVRRYPLHALQASRKH